MSYQFVQGRLYNHLTWVGVDATDFATRESALSAAWKIKIYGSLEGTTPVNFVTSGTGSLTNDIVHVGASATGVYHICLTKADLSDASAAWYDEYIVILSAAGAAYETFIIEGTRTDTSHISAVLSDIRSRVEDVYSLFSSRVPDITTTSSDLVSQVWSYPYQSRVVTLHPSDMSDLRSAITAGAAAVTVSNISDIASAVWAAPYTVHTQVTGFGSLLRQTASAASDIYSLLSDVSSDLGVMSGVQSDLYSLLSDFQSDFTSRFPATIPELTIDPGATPTWARAQALEYMWLRNNSKTTTAKRYLRNDAGTTVLSAPHAETAGVSYVQGKLG